MVVSGCGWLLLDVGGRRLLYVVVGGYVLVAAVGGSVRW